MFKTKDVCITAPVVIIVGLIVIGCGPQKRVLVKRQLNGNCGQRGAVLLSLQGSAVRCFSAWILQGFSSAARCFSACGLPSVVSIVELCRIVCEATLPPAVLVLELLQPANSLAETPVLCI